MAAMAGEAPEDHKPPDDQNEAERPVLASDLQGRRKRNSIILALILFAFVALVFVITIVRVGGNVFNNPPM